MNLNQIKQRIQTARSVGLDYLDTTPVEVQTVLMDLASIAEYLVAQRGVAPLMTPERQAALHLVTQRAALTYEIRASWWASWVPRLPFDLGSRWFVWKTRRKWRRYTYSMLG
jgi:hypothetical protein